MVLEGDAVAGDRIDPRKRITRRRGPPVGQLVDDHENDVVGRLADAVAARPLILGLHIGRSEDRQQLAPASSRKPRSLSFCDMFAAPRAA